TNAYELVIEDAAELSGLPDDVREAAATTAAERGREGRWVFTLQAPSYVPFITYADSRERRRELMHAYGRRAFGGEHDNQPVIRELVGLRHERAQLLGYASHADFVLEQRMAESPGRVHDFLEELLNHARPAGEREIAELSAYARTHGGPDALERWDHAYWAEKLKKERYAIDDELLKPYFNLERVIDGAFGVAGRLFGLRFRPVEDVPVYHPDVRTYAVADERDQHVGLLYADFFPRPGKRSGAWMTAYRGQKRTAAGEQRPLISIVCNFTKPTATKPSLLTFNEVQTLFHEFGHALHGLLADGTYESLSGTNVYWDFVELPSQVLENWTYEQKALDLFARHYETDEPIPADLVARLKESGQFMQGYQTLRQLGFARLDMAYHTTDKAGAPPTVDHVPTFERQALAATELYRPVADTSISCAFSHIFQGSYAAGYSSYKWAEVLDADAFAYFQEQGIFDRQTADRFRRHVLSAGGTEHPRELYRRFRGQDPSPEALLRRAGLVGKAADSPAGGA
ncbi:MAG: M3 family metallopeptidase, partial [Catalinimonas sp.]